ncbi:DUF6148 family protein [Porcincola intestinalis]|jgi:hypothetical protein|uniref:Uncharacterized protein n=1 Tax=Porcincola intestinalis TaxID=2606632 RepID=A0A6L5X9L0_9FIRM|nr:DUF6148 family protein [Porcincola intestinalis]MSS16115.1 hypothetical protein [Porcincola intestinalis]
MAVRVAYTLAEAQKMLGLVKEAHMELITGQAKSYKIGTREYTALDLDDLMKQIEFFSNVVESLSGSVRTKRVARIVPRDL